MPSATAMPWKSSGLVSTRTRTTFSPRADPLDRDVGVEDGPPDGRAGGGVEALGDALAAPLRALGSNWARRSWSTWAGSIRSTASRSVMTPSSTMSTAIFTAAAAVRFAIARLEHVELAALDRELEVLDVSVVLLELLADLARTPSYAAGISSPELRDLLGRPDAGDHVLALGVDEVLAVELLGRRRSVLRVNATPVPESSPMLPKTIVTTLTAVPRSWAIFWLLR